VGKSLGVGDNIGFELLLMGELVGVVDGVGLAEGVIVLLGGEEGVLLF
jgi:hypothetical protein